jgi:FtsP/CotA-like multicopper oxidase with cupredoxin domain
MNLPDPGTLDLMTIKLDGPAAALPDLPTTWASFEPIATDASTPTRNFLLYEIMMDGHMIFSINGEQYPTVTPIHATRDTVEIWTIHDDVGMDHPFHLHGNFFQVLDIDGVPVAHAGWKDTAVVPMYTHMHFAVRHGAPGHWMYHCHILEHQEGGMMGVLIVDPAP